MRNGKLAKITVELPDGTAYSGVVKDIRMDYLSNIEPVYSLGSMLPVGNIAVRQPEWYIEANGVGSLEFSPAEKYVEEIEERKSAPEYECAWCGATNLMQNRQCTQCGGFRPPITG